MSPLSAGSVTMGIKLVDESRADMTRYVTWEDCQRLREQLREAKAEAAEWEDRYWEFVGEHGGVS